VDFTIDWEQWRSFFLGITTAKRLASGADDDHDDSSISATVVHISLMGCYLIGHETPI